MNFPYGILHRTDMGIFYPSLNMAADPLVLAKYFHCHDDSYYKAYKTLQ